MYYIGSFPAMKDAAGALDTAVEICINASKMHPTGRMPHLQAYTAVSQLLCRHCMIGDVLDLFHLSIDMGNEAGPLSPNRCSRKAGPGTGARLSPAASSLLRARSFDAPTLVKFGRNSSLPPMAADRRVPRLGSMCTAVMLAVGKTA